jgi:hypothetical protein
MEIGIDPDLEQLLGFAWELAHYVKTSSPWRTGLFGSGEEKLNGIGVRMLSFDATVPVSGLFVPCSYSVFSKWWIRPPRCFCSASWIRRDIDWHVYSTGELCWVYPPYWQEVLQGVIGRLDSSVARQTAAYWFAEQSSELIGKHLVADRLSLNKWPKEWLAWPHGEAARQQYEEMRARGEVEIDIEKLITARGGSPTGHGKIR